MEKETFFSLLHDWAHWEFELFLMFLFDILLGVIVWPRLKKALIHHQSDDQKIAILERKVKFLQDKLGIEDKEEP